MAQIPSARAPVIDLPPKRHHFPEPVVTGAHGESECVARFPNCFAFDKNEAVKFWFLRLGRMVNATPEAAVYDKASLALRVYAAPSSCTRTIASPALRFSSAKYARWIEYRQPRRDFSRRGGRTARSADAPALWESRAQTIRVPCASGAVTGNFRAPLYRRLRQWTSEIAICGLISRIEVAHGGISVLAQH